MTYHFHDGLFPGDRVVELGHTEGELGGVGGFGHCVPPGHHPRGHLLVVRGPVPVLVVLVTRAGGQVSQVDLYSKTQWKEVSTVGKGDCKILIYYINHSFLKYREFRSKKFTYTQ